MQISQLEQIVNDYELLIIDLWGVIHDGSEPYPGVLQTIEYLNQQQKKIIFLSNAPRRAKQTKILLDKIGITSDKYERLLTSGEIAFNYLNQIGQKEGAKKYIFLGPDRDLDVMSESMHIHTQDPKQADFIIASGYELGVAEDVWDEQLNAAKEEGLFMYCLNPDLEIHKHDGSVHYCAGVLAQKYRALGGEVKMFGKPITDTYQYILDLYPTDKNKILCIGDNMDTDIKGAIDSQFASALICWGIPANYMKLKTEEIPNQKQIKNFLQNYSLKPTYICARF